MTTHGLSLNVNLDLEVYDLFDACGLGGADFTSVAAETGRDISVAEVGEVFEIALAEQLQLALDPLPVAV